MQKKGTVIGLMVLVVVLAGALVFTNMNFGAAEVEVKDTAQMSEDEIKLNSYVQTGHLITAATAANLMESREDVLILDVRKAVDYATGHVPGAFNVFRSDYSAAEEQYPFGGMRAGKEEMEAFMSRLGVTEDTLVIAYDAKGNYDAARLWWQMDMYGHDYYKIIDGGIQGWQAAGFELTMATPDEPTPRNYQFMNEPDYSRLASLEDVISAQTDPNVVLLDTRSIEEFTGEKLKKGATREGRIPGSVWLEYKESIAEDSCFECIDDLAAQFVALGITKDKTIIPYCQSGVRSAHTTFVLTQLLGYPNVKNYDGSWIEYSYNEDLPLETGEARVASK